jgi:hypothetical protein
MPVHAALQRASAAASPSPRFSPRPASGCMTYAASAISAVRLPIYASACQKRNGNDAMVPGWVFATSDGTAWALSSGIPTAAATGSTFADASAE